MTKKETYDFIISYISKLKWDEKLPSETQLINITGLSRGSIRDILLILQTRGFIYSIAKKGYYKRKTTNNYFETKNYYRNILMIKFDKLNLLNIDRYQKTLHVKREKINNNEVIEFQEIYFNCEMYNKINKADFTLPIETIIKQHSDIKMIELKAQVKCIKNNVNYVFSNPFFDEIVFSVYQYFNEHHEIVCLVHSYFRVDKFNIKYQKIL